MLLVRVKVTEGKAVRKVDGGHFCCGGGKKTLRDCAVGLLLVVFTGMYLAVVGKGS